MLPKNFSLDVANLLVIVRQTKPLVHNITNYVTVNDVANILLAIGASPIMADAKEEAADIASISKALVLNIGTLNERTVESMILAGKAANERNIPVIFDPVGAGASKFRNEVTNQILESVKISILRGNLSEISFIAGLQSSTKGVDVSEADLSNDAESVANLVAKKFNCTAVITGKVDIISDSKRLAKISNGHPQMSKVTGTGCMSSAITGAFAATTNDMFLAGIAALTSMGIAGEIAYEKTQNLGTGSFRNAIIDSISCLDTNTILERGKIE
ncbi:MAG: hydroxyethylthiazole kinase [Fibrobacteraceae bacterium]|nr:hydroxyethylthiazole kinase [Fibrobacteraceae bacterium]